MTLVEHLTELRSRLVKSILAIAIGASVMWFVYEPAFRWLIEVLQRTCSSDQQCDIIQTDPLQGFSTRMTFSGYGGIALAMPVVLWQLWRFVMPGLYPKERRLALPFTFTAVLLFVLGAALSLWTLPKALDFLIGIGGEDFNQFYTPDRYVAFTVKMMVAFGIGFEFPIFLVFLQLAGVLTPQSLGHVRRYAYVGIVVLVAVLTPSGDPISLAALALPMVAFYEGSILIGRFSLRRKRKRERQRAEERERAKAAGS
jgi:sec-independent protein translocase protein TatC